MNSHVDWSIVNARIVTPSGICEGTVDIRCGRVSKITDKNSKNSGDRVFDADGAWILPAMIDAHVHFNDPGRDDWEGFYRGSRAALAGGVATIIDMPLNSVPPTVSVPNLTVKKRRAIQDCQTHFGFWGGIINDCESDWVRLWEHGVLGFKLFLASSGVDEFPAVSESVVKRALQFSERTGALLLVHAEDCSTLLHNQKRVGEKSWTPMDYLRIHDSSSEVAAVDQLLYWASRLGGRLHVVHASLPDTIYRVNQAKNQGIDVSVETCPHYLVFDETDFIERGSVLKCAPPLRSRQTVEELWACLDQGLIDYVASDHSPSPEIMKTGSDVSRTWGGISGVQSTMEIMLTEGWKHRNIALSKIIPMLSTRVAQRLGLTNRGAVVPGYWADLVMVREQAAQSLTSHEIFDTHRHNPYQDFPLQTRVAATWINGQLAYSHGSWLQAESSWIVGPGISDPSIKL